MSTSGAATPVTGTHPGWWSDAVGYQVYLPSFADSDGDGWGDLDGLRSRLDHLVELGVDVVWVTPFFVSPMRDHGYDIADHRRVDPRFGGDAALDRLLDAAYRRGLRVVGDLVVNHTSDQHRWFRSARADPAGEYRDYYLWRDPAPDGGPPNNWLSHFSGPAWTLDASSGQYYLHLFDPGQPDLNWRNPAVVSEVDGIIEHWLGRGLDGFRIDTAAYLVKHTDLPDNPALPSGQVHPIRGVPDAWRRQDHRYDIHQPEVHDIHARWRRIADGHGAFLVGEVYELDPERLAGYVSAERLHSSFWFGLIEADWDPYRIRDMVRAAATASPRLSWVQSNHDRSRAATRYGGGPAGARRALAAQVLATFLPGTSWLYQGEELGLGDGTVPPGSATDPLAAADGPSRDGARTPMPWSPGTGLGFTAGRPWLPDGDRSPADTVAAQDRDPFSPLHATRRLLAAHRALRHHLTGQDVTWTDTAGTVAMYRRGGVTVAANLGEHTAPLSPVPGTVAFDTTGTSGIAPPRRLFAGQAIVVAAGTASLPEPAA